LPYEVANIIPRITRYPGQRNSKVFWTASPEIVKVLGQNMTPQDKLLWHKDYFELKAVGKKQTKVLCPLHVPKTGAKVCQLI
jgi:hypothetical protein